MSSLAASEVRAIGTPPARKSRTRPSRWRSSRRSSGAEISVVDLGRLVSDDARPNRQMDEIHRVALAENLVIFFRDRHDHARSTSPSAASSARCTFIRPRRTRATIRR